MYNVLATQKFTSIRVWGHFPVGWLVRTEGFLPIGYHRGIPPPYWRLSGSQCVGLHLRLGCLLASYPDQVLMSLRLWESWFLALSSKGCLGFWAISNPSPWEESHEFALSFYCISFLLMVIGISFFCLQPSSNVGKYFCIYFLRVCYILVMCICCSFIY